jgi:nucleotide-binding universal stress UspA family protein
MPSFVFHETSINRDSLIFSLRASSSTLFSHYLNIIPLISRTESTIRNGVWGMFRKILFATDFSDYAKNTLDCIAGFPGTGEIILLHVLEEARSPRGGGEIGEALSTNERNSLREEKRRLERIAKNFKVTAAVKTSSDIAGAILETAKEEGVSLIVVGARGNSFVDGILLGSVSMAILRRSRINIMIMRHNIVGSKTSKTYEMSCPMILSRVLCPIDFSPYSDHAINLLSRTNGVGEIILLTVVSQGETEVEIGEAIEKAKNQIEAIRRSLAVKGTEVTTIIRTGDPGSEILRIADEKDVSVIWMSSHGKGWFRGLLIGSTAHTVAMNAKKPVIIIRKPE